MIRTAFIDFDNTLAIHDWFNLKIGDTKIDDYSKLWNNGRNRELHVPLNMQLFCLTLKRHNVEMYTLTQEESSLAVKFKQDFVNEHYKGIFKDVVTSSTSRGKVDIMLGYCKAFNVPTSQVLIVDDLVDTLYAAKEAGFVCMTPQEIMCKQMYLLEEELGYRTEVPEIEGVNSDGTVA